MNKRHLTIVLVSALITCIALGIVISCQPDQPQERQQKPDCFDDCRQLQIVGKE